MSTREAPAPRPSGLETGPGPRDGARNPRGGRQVPGRAGGQGRRGAQRPARAPEVAVRRVRRVVRHVDLWSVVRFAALLYLSFLLVALVAAMGLWIVASASGARHSVEKFISSTLLLNNFQFNSLQLLLAFAGIGVILAALATGLTVLLGAFYNLISDVVGGIEVTLIEEEPLRPVV